MSAPTPDPTTARVGEQIAQAIETHRNEPDTRGMDLHTMQIAARIARNFVPVVPPTDDGATVDEVVALEGWSDVDVQKAIGSAEEAIAWSLLDQTGDIADRSPGRDEFLAAMATARKVLIALAATVPALPGVPAVPVDAGLREAIEAFLNSAWSPTVKVDDIRALIATHPAPTADEWTCTTPGCDGDGRYASPGRGHIDGCRYPLPAPPVTVTDEMVERAALTLHEISCADEECGGGDLGTYFNDARASLTAALTEGGE